VEENGCYQTMSFLRNIKDLFFPASKKNVLILGYKRAGKSTIVEQLIQHKILRQRREETHGAKTKEIQIELGETSHDFRITDIGGSQNYQDMLWKPFVAKANGMVYVIDSSLMYACKSGSLNPVDCPKPTQQGDRIICGCKDNDIFRSSRMAKSFAFSIMDTGKPLLVFLNKTDLKDQQPIHSQEELTYLYGLDNQKYNTRVETGSALTGQNVFEAIAWLFREMGT